MIKNIEFLSMLVSVSLVALIVITAIEGLHFITVSTSKQVIF